MLWYFGVGIPLYFLGYLGAASLYPEINYFNSPNYSYGNYNYGSNFSLVPQQNIAPFYIGFAAVGIFGIWYHFKLTGRYK